VADTQFTTRSPGAAVVGPNGHSAVSPAQARMADCHPGQCAGSRRFRARDPSSWRVCTDMEANALPLRNWSKALLDEATTSFVVLQLPDAPDMPPPLAGRTTIGVRFLWVGDAEEGAGLLDQIRAVAPVVLDDAALKPHTAVDSVHADPVDPMPVKEASMLLADFPDDAVARFLDRVGPGTHSPQIMAEIRQLGGAYARAGEHPSAFVHRNAAFSLLTVGIAFDPRVVPHAHDLISALSDWDTGGVWPNFAPPHDEATAQRAYDPATLAHLADVAQRYDPDAVLTAGAFVRPIAEEAAA
jgi:hypothetical protein